MPPKALSANKTEKVGCQVCKETVAWQNYERHLKRFHPLEDPKDRRACGEQKLTFNKSKKVEGDSNENNNEDEDGPARGVRRARNEDTAEEHRKVAAQVVVSDEEDHPSEEDLKISEQDHCQNEQ